MNRVKLVLKDRDDVVIECHDCTVEKAAHLAQEFVTQMCADEAPLPGSISFYPFTVKEEEDAD